jgi:hypothetical protein
MLEFRAAHLKQPWREQILISVCLLFGFSLHADHFDAAISSARGAMRACAVEGQSPDQTRFQGVLIAYTNALTKASNSMCNLALAKGEMAWVIKSRRVAAEVDQVKAIIDDAFTNCPLNASLLYKRGVVHAMQFKITKNRHDAEMARAAFVQARQLAPTNAYVCMGFASLELVEGNVDAGKELLRDYLDLTKKPEDLEQYAELEGYNLAVMRDRRRSYAEWLNHE